MDGFPCRPVNRLQSNIALALLHPILHQPAPSDNRSAEEQHDVVVEPPATFPILSRRTALGLSIIIREIISGPLSAGGSTALRINGAGSRVLSAERENSHPD